MDQKQLEERIAELSAFIAQGETEVARWHQQRNAINTRMDEKLEQLHAANAARGECQMWLAKLMGNVLEAEGEIPEDGSKEA